MKHVFIIDPKPFHGQQWRMDGLLDTIGQFFRTQDKPNFTTLVSKYPRESIGLIQKQIDENEDEWETVRVYAVGGAEILFDCLNGIAGLQRVELAMIPYGVPYDFIRTFGEGKAELFRDIPALANSDSITTDIIAVGNNYALNSCAVGLTPAVAAKMKDLISSVSNGLGRSTLGLQSFLGRLATVFNKEIISHRYKVTIDDVDYSGNYSQIIVLNGPFFDRAKTAMPGVAPNDGLLDIILFKSTGSLSLLSSMRKFSHGKVSSNCTYVQAKKISISTDKPSWIQMDSELLLDTSISFEIVTGEVQVVTVNDLTYQKF